MPELGIVVQARMGSARLPGKVLVPIGDRPLLGHIIDRLRSMKKNAPFVIATTIEPQDEAIVEFCRAEGVPVFRGSESDVLERYYLCARQFDFENVVRLTADNPYFDVEELERLLDLFFRQKPDYADSFSTLPIGVGAEVFTFGALEKSYREGHAPHHREHVNEYMQENPQLFRRLTLQAPPTKRFPQVRLTVDRPEDLRRVRFIREQVKGPVTTEAAVTMALKFDEMERT
jgi:spore coat polysaccharide biosynthesis protein SpsF